MRGAALLMLVFCTFACGDKPAPMTPDNTTAAADAGPDPDVVGDNPAQPKPRKPFTIHNSCTDVVNVVFGDDPKSDKADRRRIAPNSEDQGPRDAEGKATVNLVDATKNETLATVHVTRGMKQVEVGRSCRTLDAR